MKFLFQLIKNNIFAVLILADVAELVDALDLGSSAVRRGGSTPFIRTKSSLKSELFYASK